MFPVKQLSPLSSTFSSFVFGCLVGQLYRDTPQRLSAFISFLIRFHITGRTKSLTTRCNCVFFFILKTPARAQYFLPFPLVVVGSLLANVKVNEPQQHTVSQLGEPVLAFKCSVRGLELLLQW